MEIDLAGAPVQLLGERNAVAEASLASLLGNGGVPHEGAGAPALLLGSLPLLPADGFDAAPWRRRLGAAAEAMAPGGRVVLLLSSAAAVPMRRHPAFSEEMAAMRAFLRGLAMRLAPGIRANAVGVGAVGAPLIAGDAAMLGHAPVGRPGTIAEVADAVLFLADPMNAYLTGQVLCVDGGWSAGYGRSF